MVTGGAGFIGSAVVGALLERGHDVTVLDNLSSGYRANLRPDVELFDTDVRDAHAVIRAMKGRDAVLHLAASVGNKRSIENPTNDATTNAVGTLNVLEAARIAGCWKVVYSSSAAIYGEPMRLPVDEDHPKRPLTPYAVSKLAGEHYMLAYSALYGISGVALRYFNVYGPGQRFDAYGNAIPIFAQHIQDGRPIVIYDDGEQTRDFVHVSDVAMANVLAAEANGVSGAFNVASGSATTISELVRLMLTVSGRSVRVDHAAPRAGDVRHIRGDISAIRSALAYAPHRPLEAGLRDYFTWMRPTLG